VRPTAAATCTTDVHAIATLAFPNKTISYWTAPQPQDAEAFEEFYQQVHGPMAARVPGVQKLELSRASDGFARQPHRSTGSRKCTSTTGQQWAAPP
jgi:hypothetical protein